MSEENLRDLGVTQICEYQQNRYPVLLIDRIVEAKPGAWAKGLKAFSYNEWFFPGHFEDDPNVPGFVQVECLVQVFIMSFLTLPEYKGMKTNFVTIDNVHFRKKIVPGDTLEIYAELLSGKRGIMKGTACGSISGEEACRMDVVVSIPEVLDRFRPRIAS
ncbi:beta-hydroxyacyl-ACP dehydratase [Haematospirillum sp. H1815]|uniref:3-hydroxyacyl-ACP dehydratase FabZ family protein n=1 Tax=Haematospirillum sp. H1815 TaxID=2723108 RepID=UPI00143C99FB|nr:3-hydroxyacyl-ACP dehydratase FabZ family protein [Haematospirillum sp. H1815]NKD77973.1 beta-hydroxyacyl-ACP dehydratase [Haematospirillum sp. H1815]